MTENTVTPPTLPHWQNFVPNVRPTSPKTAGTKRSLARRRSSRNGAQKPRRSAGQSESYLACNPVPGRPASSYRRLSRYDETGLIWLLRSRPVVVLTETTAAIQGATAVLTYRKINRPALGPVGDSLDDFGAVT